MNNKDKIFQLLSKMLENGILTSQDARKEIINSLKFKRDNFVDKLRLVPREEFEVLKKIVNKQQILIDKLSTKKKIKKVRKP